MTEVEALKERVKELEEILTSAGKGLAAAYHLTPKEEAILGALVALPEVTIETIEDRLKITNHAYVAIHRLRKHLNFYGVHIRKRKRHGYWLDEETKGKIRKRLEDRGVIG